MSARRRLLLGLAGLGALGAARSVRADDDLPAAPPGFTWVTPVNGVGSFLRPDGWFTREETHGDTQAFFITKTPIVEGGRFEVGLTVNMFDGVSHTGATPSGRARDLAARLAARGQVLIANVVKGNAADMNVVRVVDRGGAVPVEIHYIAIGKDAADRTWLIFFEAPLSQWDALYPIARPMINAFAL